MKNKIYTFIFLFICSANVSLIGQTITSVQNGNWLTPTVWDCGCIPTPGANIVVNHAINLNTNWAFSTGSLTIGSAGTLTEMGGLRTIAIYGTGSFANTGTVDISKMAAFAGTISNNGSLTVTDSLYINIALINGASGTIVSNNFYSGNHLTNNGNINAVNFLNNGIFENYDQCHFTNFLNNLTGQNSGTIEFYDFYNNDSFANTAQLTGTYDFTNAGDFFNTGNITVAHDFTNGDSINGDAYFNNMGHFLIENDMANMDSLTGSSSGQYCVGQNSANFGVFYGEFDFCDQTPPASSPYIDLISGPVSASITYCATPCNSALADESDITNTVALFPNPASDMITLTSNCSIKQIEIIDISGKLIVKVFPNSIEASVFVNELEKGVYFIKIQTENSIQVKKLQVL